MNSAISQNCIVPKLQILVPLNTTQVITTYDNSNTNKTCDDRKSKAIIQCLNGKLSVSGSLFNDYSCSIARTSGSTLNSSCTHPATGTIFSGESSSLVTYSQSSVTSPTTCDSVKKVFTITCNNGTLITSGSTGSFQNCIQSQPESQHCFDTTSQRSIMNDSSIQITSYNGPEYFSRGLCNQNMLNYTAYCVNGMVTRLGTIGSFLNCQEIITEPNSRVGKLELKINKTEVGFNENFTVYIENKSNRSVEINKSTFDIVGFFSQKSYLTEPDISIKAMGSCPLQILPGDRCFILIQNDRYLSPPKGSFATVMAVIQAKYENESILIIEKSADNTTPLWDNSIDLRGP